jgi:hypothetical protein
LQVVELLEKQTPRVISNWQMGVRGKDLCLRQQVCLVLSCK